MSSLTKVSSPRTSAFRGMETPSEEIAEAKSKGMRRETKKVGSRIGKPRITRGGYRGGSYR